MEEINKLNDFEAFLRLHREERPVKLYNAEENQCYSSSKVLKPQDVIAIVSKQLKDIQKADNSIKGCVRHNIKPKKSEFIPISVLYTSKDFQYDDSSKFETQCVTDTQLIDIVDNVEAMVNVNNVSKKPCSFNECNSENITKEDIVTVGRANNHSAKEPIVTDLKNIKPICIQNDELGVNDINTEIFTDFDIPYSEIESIHICRPDLGDNNHKTTRHLSQDVSSTSFKILKHIEETPFIVKCNKLSCVTKEQREEITDNPNNTQDKKDWRDNTPNELFPVLSVENVSGLTEKIERSSSPIIQNYKSTVKTKTLSPLIYPLETFEKFESLAMPLIEENADFEAAKNLINSQLIDNQFIIFSNTMLNLEKPSDNILCNINNGNDNNIINKDDNVDSKEKTSKSASFDDEILFSSDEENESMHYSREDLPLTCALKTSFYGPEIDLNETIFVGFQTSSDKCIQVSKDSFVKAQKLFSSIDKEKNNNLTLTELVDIYDSKSSNFNNNVPEIFQPNHDEDNEKVLRPNIINDNVKVLDDEKFGGFKTAYGKSIAISEKALLKCNTIFKDIELDFEETTGGLKKTTKKRQILPCEIEGNKRTRSSDESSAKCSVTLKDFEQNTCINNDYLNLEDQTILQEFENESIEEASYKHNETYCNVLQVVKETEIVGKQFDAHFNTNENLFQDNDRVCESDLCKNFDPGITEYKKISHLQDPPNFFGFKTANNKEIKVSTEAMAKTKDIFHDIGFEDMCKNKRNTDHNIEHNVNDETVTTKCYQKEKKDPRTIFQGFKTASNKIVQISKETLSKCEKIFNDIDFICKEDLSTRSNSDDVKLLNKNFNTSFSFQGFKTASNKNVDVSEEAIFNTKKFFKDLFQHDVDEKIEEPSHSIHDIASNVENVSNLNMDPGFFGFKTANNKPVIVSEKSLLKTKNFFENIDGFGYNWDETAGGFDKKELSTKNLPSDTLGTSTFEKTASYRQTAPSNNPLASAKLLCDNLDGQNICLSGEDKAEKVKEANNSKIEPGFLGFQTANNKPVVISKDSLLKSRKIFENIFESISDKDITDESDKNELKSSTTEYINHYTESVTCAGPNTLNGALAKETFMHSNMDGNIFRSKKADKENKVNASKGFQTASNKCVKVSHEAIVKSRKIFDDINFDVYNDEDPLKRGIFVTDEDINKENLKFENENAMQGFKLLSKKSDVLFEKSLNKSKQLCSDFGNGVKKLNKNIKHLTMQNNSAIGIENNIILHSTIDTQLLNNFEVSLHTEDFHDKTIPKQRKRSSSPILSCPKAKKRKKFETPYRTDKDCSIIKKDEFKINNNLDASYLFPEHYKKTKLYSLRDIDKIDGKELNSVMDPFILNLNFDNLLKFEFEGVRNDFTDKKWTTDDVKICFVESVDRKIIPDGWLDNHLKLILWKLVSYEIRFPNVMRCVCTVKNVLDQLKYRYDKELYRVERPALRKLLEKDDISTKTMILAVVGVYINGDNRPGIPNPSSNVELLVTDGWYCVKACTDRMLSRLVSEGKISAGRKIATVGAELLNCEQGVSPWEDTSAVRLKLFGNSTRPAHWDARLGFHSTGTILSHLSTIDPSGGKVCKTRALVLRVYPALYVEKLEDGSTVTRSERLEHLYQIKYESERQIRLEKLYEEVEKEFDQESSGSEGMDVELRKSNQTGSQLNRLMRKSNDPSQFRSHLTNSQALLLQEYSSRNKEKIVEELQKRVQDKIQAQRLQLGRNVIPLLKIRVAGIEGNDTVKISKAMISIWRPSDAILDVVKEGTWIDVFNVVPTAVRNSEVQISAGRQSVFHRSKFKEKANMKPYIDSLQRKCFTLKDLNNIPNQSDFNEIDTVGIVFLIEPSLNDFGSKRGQQFQNVYITDPDKNFICINFWGGIKKFGYENIFDPGNVIACMNLQKRAGNTRKTIPQYRATELTVFTKTPKLEHLRNMIEELIKKLSGLDKRKLCDDCIVIKNNYATIKYCSEFSPYRFNTSEYNLGRNKMFIDSPLVQNKDVNLNLSGLDFESTFRQADTQDFSPAIIKQKQVAKEKIAKLKMYGEPPPLSKIHIINKSKNAGSAYKSPLTSNVTRSKNSDDSPTSTNELDHFSPVLSMNRTFVVKSGMNPVKLNFSSTSVCDEKSEPNPFEEEFEASPPLSLE